MTAVTTKTAFAQNLCVNGYDLQKEQSLVEKHLFERFNLSFQLPVNIEINIDSNLSSFEGYIKYLSPNDMKIDFGLGIFDEKKRLRLVSHELFHAIMYTYRSDARMSEREGLAMLSEFLVTGTPHSSEPTSFEKEEIGFETLPTTQEQRIQQYGTWSSFYRFWYEQCSGEKNFKNAIVNGIESTLTAPSGICSSFNALFTEYEIRKHGHSWNRHLNDFHPYPAIHKTRAESLPAYSGRSYYRMNECAEGDFVIDQNVCLQIRLN